MDKANQKILTLSFAIVGALSGLTVSVLFKSLASAFGFFARASDSDLVRHGVPVFVGFAIFFALQFNKNVLSWGDEVVVEIKKVVWPSRKDTTAMTIVVCIMVLISSLIVTSFDFLSGFVVNQLIK